MSSAGTPETSTDPISFRQAFFLPSTVKRGIKVGLFVGTLLFLINQGQHILAGNWPPLWEILLTYLVPYSVSSHATAANISELSKQQSLKIPDEEV